MLTFGSTGLGYDTDGVLYIGRPPEIVVNDGAAPAIDLNPALITLDHLIELLLEQQRRGRSVHLMGHVICTVTEQKESTPA